MTPPTKDATAKPTRGRPPKGSPALTREAILASAIAVIDSDGVENTSMRTVARRLGVDAKSLYNHVDGKDGLLDAVAEHILAGFAIPEPTGSLGPDLMAFARSFRRTTLRHPRAAALVLTRQVASAAGLAPTAAILSVLRAAGFGPGESVHLLRSLLALTVGALLREVEAGPTFGVGDPDGIADRRRALEGSGHPALSEVAAQLARCDHEEEFEFALGLMIDAVARRAAHAA
ncbi:TetR/AcrR family transcriptional regulator C-terminal domain-containing protein [Phytomonospora sp. NPDC050363]|uniref:TetR/AcrR family transcriptional regulator C-terminal domain-containing protein n=1 Tax=Phytomonospora sp. NPDC050363 TaxID=3155642 RepID=UPI00340D53F2